MSILIKGLNMPKGDGLVISIEPNGEVYVQTQEGFSFFASNAKAVEVPTPHGDLIDREEVEEQVEVMHKVNGLDRGLMDVALAYDIAPTVIEAEGEEHDS